MIFKPSFTIKIKRCFVSLLLAISAGTVPLKSSLAEQVFMICKTSAIGNKAISNGPIFHANLDLGNKNLTWNGFNSAKFDITEGRFLGYLECDPGQNGCMRPFVSIDRYTGDFDFQTWSDTGSYSGRCSLADKKKKLF